MRLSAVAILAKHHRLSGANSPPIGRKSANKAGPLCVAAAGRRSAPTIFHKWAETCFSSSSHHNGRFATGGEPAIPGSPGPCHYSSRPLALHVQHRQCRLSLAHGFSGRGRNSLYSRHKTACHGLVAHHSLGRPTPRATSASRTIVFRFPSTGSGKPIRRLQQKRCNVSSFLTLKSNSRAYVLMVLPHVCGFIC